MARTKLVEKKKKLDVLPMVVLTFFEKQKIEKKKKKRGGGPKGSRRKEWPWRPKSGRRRRREMNRNSGIQKIVPTSLRGSEHVWGHATINRDHHKTDIKQHTR